MSILKNIFSKNKVDTLLTEGYEAYKSRDFNRTLSLMREVLQTDHLNTNALYFSALAEMKLKNYQSSLEFFDKIIQNDSGCESKVYYYKSAALEESGQEDLALTTLNKLIQKDPAFTEAYYKRALLNKNISDAQSVISDLDVYLSKIQHIYSVFLFRAEMKVKLGEYARAVPDLLKSIELNQNSSETYNLLGYVRYKLGDQNEAVTCYEKAIELNPKNYEAYYNFALMHNGNGEADNAIDKLNKAIEISTDCKKCLKLRSEIYLSLEMYEEASEGFSKMIQLDPADKEILLLQGDLLFKLKKYPEAAAVYINIIDIDSTYTGAYLRLAEAYIETAEYDKALDLLDQLLGNQENGRGYALKGITFLKKKLYSKAVLELNKALNLVPDDLTLYYYRALAKKELCDTSGALTDFTKALMKPNYVEVYIARAELKMQIQDYQGAYFDYEKAANIDQTYFKGYYLKALCLKHLEDYDTALREITRAINGLPNDADCYFLRGMIHLNLRFMKNAVIDFENALELGLKENRATAEALLAQIRKNI